MKSNLSTAVIILSFLVNSAQAGLWQVDNIRAKSLDSDSTLPGTRYYQLNDIEMRQTLNNVDYLGIDSGSIIELPTADGTIERFSIKRDSILAPELAAQYPEISTYKIQGIDSPHATGRVSLTPNGFSGAIYSDAGLYYIDPENSQQRYKAFHPTLDEGQGEHSNCEVVDLIDPERKAKTTLPTDRQSYPVTRVAVGKLLEYRLAIGTTFEFTRAAGGTKAKTLAVVTTIVNRINEVYERELRVTFKLIPETVDFFFTTSKDPYTGAWATTGEENSVAMYPIRDKFDLGHVFAGRYGLGGLSALSSICSTGVRNNGSHKAFGSSFTLSPTHPGFPLLIAHEMGHQFGADHTYSGKDGACNRAGNGSEPGSGSTIMSYAGKCGQLNVQSFKDGMFHSTSFDRMIGTHSRSINRSSCGVVLKDIGNNHHPVINAGSDYTIPKSTPFKLTATASDADGDTLSYTWDENDIQYNDYTMPKGFESYGRDTTVTTYGTDTGKNTLMRSRMPTTDNYRYFPQLKKILGEETSTAAIKSEVLPTRSRILRFRVTARDNRGELEYDQVDITSTTSAGPFKVTSHGATSNLNAGSSTTVNWDVAGTNGGAVNCRNVDIQLLMQDSNQKYCEVPMLTSTTNDGSASVTLPNLRSSKARIKVSCSNNVFFALSTRNININGGQALDCSQYNNGTGNQAPTANAGSDKNTKQGQTVILNGSGSDSDGTIKSYQWKEGSSVLANTATLNYTHNTTGAHTLQLTVTDNDGATGSDSVIVNVTAVVVPNKPPTANAGLDRNIQQGQTVILTGSGSDSDGTIKSYQWKEGGSVLSTNKSFSYTSAQIGLHTLTLTVTDDDGDDGSDTAVINVTTAVNPNNEAPVANAGNDITQTPGKAVIIDGRASTDDNGISTYQWTLDNKVVSTSYNYRTSSRLALGQYTFTLKVTDASGLFDIDTVVVTIANTSPVNKAPTASAGSDKNVPQGQTVTLTGSGRDSDGTISSYQWKEGGSVLANTATLNYTHNTIGTHTLQLTVTDNDGATGSDSVIVNVTAVVVPNKPPTANAGSDKKIQQGQTVKLTGSGSDSDGTIKSYQWKEGSSVLANTATLSYTHNTIGDHTLQLIVTDNDGATGRDSVAVNVTAVVVPNQAPIAKAGADVIKIEGQTVTLDGSNSSDDKGISYYRWYLNDTAKGYRAVYSTSSLAVGTHTFTLIVKDAQYLSDTDDVIVTITKANQAPTADAGSDKIIKQNQTVTLTGSGSDSDGTIASYQWKEGGLVLSNTATLNYTHGTTGDHTLQLIVTDNDGATSSDSMTVKVEKSNSNHSRQALSAILLLLGP